jgi:photoactive yellow protein
MSFVDDKTLEEISDMSVDELDNLDYGAVKLDEAGVVQEYNQYESEMARVDPEDVKGCNFFTEVASCTNNHFFHGQFQDGMERDEPEFLNRPEL